MPAAIFSTLPSLGGVGVEKITRNNSNSVFDGAVYLVTQSGSADFPVTPGAEQTAFGGGTDLTVTKFQFCPPTAADNMISPATQEVCQNGLPDILVGSPAAQVMPSDLPQLIRGSLVEDQPAQSWTDYQWQEAPSPTGPWTDAPAGILQDYLPSIGTQDMYYRRLVVPPACCPDTDPLSTSNVIEITVNGNQAPTVDGGGTRLYLSGYASPHWR
jgi:hypothetical protein